MSKYPEINDKDEIYPESAKASKQVIVKLESHHCGLDLGIYLHGLGIWKVSGFSGRDPVISEWWNLPELGTGFQLPQAV